MPRTPILALLALHTGCQTGLEGPQPEAVSLSPGLVCGDQLTTPLSLTGEALRPLPTGVLGEDPSLTLPRVSLVPVAALAGGAPPTEAFDFVGRTVWNDQTSLTLTVDPELALVEGVYDLQVQNPDGQTADLASALAVSAPPRLDTLAPDLVCVADGPRTLALRGGGYLEIEGELPTVQIGELALTPTQAVDCVDLEGPVVGRWCAGLDVELPEGSLAAGVYDAVVTNPSTAACATTEVVRVEIVDRPTVASVAEQPACAEQGPRGFEVSGAGYLRLADGTLPSLVVGGAPIPVTALDDCEALQGPSGGERCATLRFELNPGDVTPELHELTITNPDPAGCVSAPAELQLVPPPELSLVAAELECVAQGAQTVRLEGAGFVRLADGTLPSVSVGDGLSVEASAAEGCEPLPGQAGGEACLAIEAELPEASLEAGVYTVLVTNPGASDCVTTEAIALEVIGQPEVTALNPLLTCLEQGGREIEITGTGFLRLDDATVPAVRLGALEGTLLSADGCEPLAGPAGGELCTTLTVLFDDEAAALGLADLSVSNPEPASCASEEPVGVAIVEAPSVASVDRPLFCGDEEDTALVLTGASFLEIDGALPAVRIGEVVLTATAVDDCVEMEAPVPTRSCGQLTVVAPAGALASGALPVIVEHAGDVGCSSEELVTVEHVGAPVVAAIEPSELCTAAGDIQLTIVGERFAEIGGQRPEITLGGRSFPVAALGGCAPLAAGGQLCTELEVAIPAATWTAESSQALTVVNPAPVACEAVEPPALQITPPPQIAQVQPALTCSGEDLTVIGTGFGRSSTAKVHGFDAEVEWVDASTLAVKVPEGLPLNTSLAVTIETPGGCSDEQPAAVALVEAPTLSSVDQLLVCGDDADLRFQLTGRTFLETSGAKPTVSFGDFEVEVATLSGCSPITGGRTCTGAEVVVPRGSLAAGLLDITIRNPPPASCASSDPIQVEVVPAPTLSALVPVEQCWEIGAFELRAEGDGFLVVDGDYPTVRVGDRAFVATSAEDCTPLTGPAGGELCGAVIVEVPEATWNAAQSLPAEVTNPDPAACTSTEDVAFTLYDPPRAVAIEPSRVCEGGLDVALRGTGFRDGATVTIDGRDAPAVFVSDTELTVTLPAPMTPGLYDVTVTNPDTCDHTLVEGLDVVTPPILFFIDPPSTYAGINVQGTVYISGANDGVVDVWLEEDATGNRTALEFLWNPDEPNRVFATIPEGLTDGAYTAFMEDGVGCEVALPDAMNVEDSLTLDVTDVVEPFGWTDDTTAVKVLGAGFVDLPRVYLNPVVQSEGTVATELYGITWQAAAELDAIVRDGLPAGLYDVLVINPDGAVGLLEAGFEVTELAPPIVDSASPASVPNSTPIDITLRGSNFRNPTVTWECVDPATGGLVEANGARQSFTATQIVDRMPANTLGGRVCVALVTNDDGTYVRYAAVSVTNPSQNIYPFKQGSQLTTARRAPATYAGRPTRTARYLYAVGGDSGANASALTSMERASVGLYGDLGPWSALPTQLPEARTLAGYAQLGRFVYLVGGNNRTTAVDTVWRAQVLDPLETPRIERVELDYGDGTNLSGGTWIYRISAVYPANDPSNPGGESLPGDPQVVRLPDLSDTVTVSLEWSAVPRAVGYRVYRSPEADAGSNAEVFLTEVSTTSYVDRAEATPDTARRPLPAAALGRWAALPPLPRALEGACVAFATDPSNAAVSHLFVGGGRDAAGTVRAEVLSLPVTRVSDQLQTPGAWKDAGRTLVPARWQCGAFATTSQLHSRITGTDTWLYFGGGRTSGGTTGNFDAGKVAAGGTFSEWYAVDSGRSSAGYAYANASNFLYVFGGTNGAPDTTGTSAEICATGVPGCNSGPPDPPDLKNWNNLGTGLLAPRYLPGSVQESSVVFVIGGQTNSEAATRLVDRTNY